MCFSSSVFYICECHIARVAWQRPREGGERGGKIVADHLHNTYHTPPSYNSDHYFVFVFCTSQFIFVFLYFCNLYFCLLYLSGKIVADHTYNTYHTPPSYNHHFTILTIPTNLERNTSREQLKNMQKGKKVKNQHQ